VKGNVCLCPAALAPPFPLSYITHQLTPSLRQPNPRVGVAIGDYVLDLTQVSGLFQGPLLAGKAADLFSQVRVACVRLSSLIFLTAARATSRAA
jgi:hypothetical protein